MNQELQDYVSKSRASGMSDEEIKKQLLTSGWQDGDVNEVISGVPLVASQNDDMLAQQEKPQFRPASQKRRFVNYLIDGLFLLFTVGLVAFVPREIIWFWSLWVNDYVIVFLLAFLYYFGFEVVLGKTPGKFLTKTRVIAKDGSRVGIKACLLRTLIRFVPLEFLSFLRRGIGWHDRWTGTLVVESSLLPEPKRARAWKILFRTVAVPVSIFTVFSYIILSSLLFLNIFPGKDILLPDDSDIRLSIVNISDEQNGYYEALRIKDVIYHPDTVFELLDGENWDQAEVEEILAKNTETFALLDAILEKPYLQNPNYMDPEHFDFYYELEEEEIMLVDYRALARISGIRARHLARTGNPNEAMSLALKVVVLGDRIQKGQGQLWDYLVGVSVKVYSLRSTKASFDHREVLAYDDLSSENLIAYVVELGKYRNKKEDLERAIKSEGYTIRINDYAMTIAEDIFKENPDISQIFGTPEKFLESNWLLKPNKTRQLQINYIRDNLKNGEGFCDTVENVGHEDTVGNGDRNLLFDVVYRTIKNRNIIGEILESLIRLDLSTSYRRICTDNFSLDAVRLAYAIRAYELENKKLPINLNELTPRYISKVPVDPYDGQPMRYSASDRLIYSIGKDATGSKWDNLKGFFVYPF